MDLNMIFFKKFPLFHFLSILGIILTLGIHELQAADTASTDPKAELLRKYPLTEEGNSRLKYDAGKTHEEALLDELVARYSRNQLTLSSDTSQKLCQRFHSSAKECVGDRWSSNQDFGKAAKEFLRAAKLGDQTARVSLNGLIKQVEDCTFGSDQRNAQFEKLMRVVLSDTTPGEIDLLWTVIQRPRQTQK
jgi:hypothetical protein